MPFQILGLIVFSALAASAAPPIDACPAGKPLASFDLGVQAGDNADQTPIRAVTRLDGGSRLVYKPRELFGGSSDAEVALISIPTTPTGVLGVLDVRPASGSAEWVIPSRAAAVALVYGPQGLSLGKVAKLVFQDRDLITQLATYAEKSAQTEALMEALAASERSGSGQTVEAALQGFTSRYGVALPTLSKGASPDQQALTMMRALHPSIGTIDPLASSSTGLMLQSGSLAASVAGLFLGNPVGLATAGGAMVLNLRSLFFPGSEFRSALVQQAGGASVLCAKREAGKSRTKLVYLWAWKIQGPPAPRLDGLPYRVNLGMENLVLPVKGANLERIRGIKTNVETAQVQWLADQAAFSLNLPPTASRGDRLDVVVEVEDSPTPIVFPGAIEVLGRRPVLQSVNASVPNDLPLELSTGEIPANAFTAVTIRTADSDTQATLHLECTDPKLTIRKLSLRAGEQSGGARLRAVTRGELFLSFEAGTIGQPPCDVSAQLETADGLSQPTVIGRLVRMPRIDKFSLQSELVGDSIYSGWIEGEELETIEKTGWREGAGVPVREAPLPVDNKGSRQRLKIAMPWPPPAPRSALYVWLRGETMGRKSGVVY
ncbi:MAG: hypothetical protein JST93_36400 [Acidobacteria bacterium]|nr:hypothetical protein [Acidobacteriota bacterium]